MPASSILSEEIVPPYSLVREDETCLQRRLSLPVAYLLNNRIGTAVDMSMEPPKIAGWIVPRLERLCGQES